MESIDDRESGELPQREVKAMFYKQKPIEIEKRSEYQDDSEAGEIRPPST
jgi:hypothetical protein